MSDLRGRGSGRTLATGKPLRGPGQVGSEFPDRCLLQAPEAAEGSSGEGVGGGGEGSVQQVFVACPLRTAVVVCPSSQEGPCLSHVPSNTEKCFQLSQYVRNIGLE